VKAELYRPDDPATVVAIATWSEGVANIAVTGEPVEGIERLLRRIPVVVRDASLLPQGSHGEAVLQPDSLEWFRAALPTRSESLGLAVRFVALDVRNGWDPASNYRTFADQAMRLATSEPGRLVPEL
jgi:hypothetical protein